jgi:hypothetical protein
MLVAIKYTSIKPHVSDAPFKRLREHSLAPEMVILPNIALYENPFAFPKNPH